MEWEPPTQGEEDGYIKWYMNEQFLYGINGHSLNITGASIPSEPMYLIMNTAVAKSWGFPIPCPEGCDCSCFECGNPDCDCALPPGYCENGPAHFEIDYVRVWHAKNDPKHKIGCSTRDRPTELFIKGHTDRYTEKDQKQPLKPIRRGGAECSSDLDCGGVARDIHGIDHVRGLCNKGLCECSRKYTGSSCLSHFGFDDQHYSQIDNHLEGTMIFVHA